MPIENSHSPTTGSTDAPPTSVYWHRELPPIDAEPMAEHILEATSSRVPNTLAHHDELWDRLYEELMSHASTRLEQEIVRLAGSCAHVLDELIDSRHDDVSGESWLHGSFTYMLYGLPNKKRPITASSA